MEESRQVYLIRFLRGCAGAADDGQLGVELGKLMVNGDLMREAADEFEKLLKASVEVPAHTAISQRTAYQVLKAAGWFADPSHDIQALSRRIDQEA